MSRDEARAIIQRGFWGTVEYARRGDGAMEARDWLESQDATIQSRFDHLFRKIASVGKIANTEQFRKLQGQIWEFKRGGDRIPCFRIANSWCLTHHFKKSGQKCPKKEIERAELIRSEHLARSTS